ncbi:MAG: hypothetical protein HZA31_10130 [Opitutae bacterium]|nr:hypothetical protein [Opitutae bacterium]
MTPIDLYDFRDGFKQDGTLICFAGPFSHSIIEELGNAVRRYLETEQVAKASLMDVFSVFIEQTQNVRNYAARKAAEGDAAADYNDAIVVIGKAGDRYVIRSGNLVAQADVGTLAAHLDKLRALDAAALRQLYKEQMRRPLAPGQHSAGLGLIDMSRKAAQPLDYNLRPVSDHCSFFSLRALV